MDSRLGTLIAGALVTVLAAINFLVGLGDPPQPVWDESYYLTSVQRYEEGVAQFASHPPLGLMLMTAGDVLLQPNHGIDTREIGRDKKLTSALPQGYSFTGVRLMSGVFAVVGAVLFFAIMRTLTRSTVAALVFSNLYLFENSFIAHFRAAHLDAFQLAFTLLALLCVINSVQRTPRESPGLDFGFGAACGLAMMVKLNAVVLAVSGAMLLAYRMGAGWLDPQSADAQSAGTRSALWERLGPVCRAGRGALLMGAGCVIAVTAVFATHVALGRRVPDVRTPAGAKDAAYVSPAYRQYLEHERALSAAVILAAGEDYLHFISADFTGMARTDPNGSQPLSWPLHEGTINYRWDSTGPWTSYVQLTGNPVGWLLGLLAALGAAGLLILQWLRPVAAATDGRDALEGEVRLSGESSSSTTMTPVGRYRIRQLLMLMLLVQYLIFLTVHVYLGLQRVMYLYHYFIGLILAFCLLPLVLTEAAERWPALHARREPILVTLSALLLGSFLFYSPLSFHRPLTHTQCEWRNVLQHVVNCR